jgi:glycosyltransferase involved in cell wall biosynthesis
MALAKRPLDVLWASDALVPAAGGAERSTLEWLAALAERGHRPRAVCIEGPPRAEAMAVPDEIAVTAVQAPRSASRPRDAWYWRARLDRCHAMHAAVTAAIAERRPDVVVGQLHGAPGALAAAAEAGIARVLVLHSYESLCKVAFDPGSECQPPRDCRSCPHAATLSTSERSALLELRARHDDSVGDAGEIIAPSESVAGSLERWSGRRATVVRYAFAAPHGVAGDYAGPVLFAANRWAPHKGVDLLPALVELARRVPGPTRSVHVTRRGLDERTVDSLEAAGAEIVENAPFETLANGASAVVVPSQWEEPFARLGWEPMAAGIPAIVADAGGFSELVSPNLLVSPRNDIDAWAAAFDRLFASREAWATASADCVRGANAILDPPPAGALESVLREAADAPLAIGEPGAV